MLIDIPSLNFKNTHLRNISREGKTGLIGFTGPSGIGKTTLLKIIGGLYYVPGKVIYKGKNIFDYSFSELDKYRSRIGRLFQDLQLLENLTAQENIMLARPIDEDYRELSQQLEIDHLLTVKVRNLSGGQQERVAIVKSLAHYPDICLMDEVGMSLQSDLKHRVYEAIKKYARTHLVFVSSHDTEFFPYFDYHYDLTTHIKN